MSAEFTRDKETESPGQLTQLSKQLLGLPEKPAGATTAADIPLVAMSRHRKYSRIIQILSAINCRFLGPNSR
jgi:hypothetical protein